MSQPGVEIGSGMPSRPLPGLSSALPVMTISWHGAFSTMRGAIGRCDRPHPALVHLLERAAEPDAIDLAVGGEPADQHRDVVLAPLGVDHVGEQERLAVPLGDAAAELPAHQRVHLGVLVDRPVDPDQQAGLVERADVVVQVGIGALVAGRVSLRLGEGVHVGLIARSAMPIRVSRYRRASDAGLTASPARIALMPISLSPPPARRAGSGLRSCRAPSSSRRRG